MKRRRVSRKALRHIRLESWGTGLGIQCKDDENENYILLLSPDHAVKLGSELTEIAVRMAFDEVRDARLRARALVRQRERSKPTR